MSNAQFQNIESSDNENVKVENLLKTGIESILQAFDIKNSMLLTKEQENKNYISQLQRQITLLKEENEILKQENTFYKKENEELKNANSKLNTSLKKKKTIMKLTRNPEEDFQHQFKTKSMNFDNFLYSNFCNYTPKEINKTNSNLSSKYKLTRNDLLKFSGNQNTYGNEDTLFNTFLKNYKKSQNAKGLNEIQTNSTKFINSTFNQKMDKRCVIKPNNTDINQNFSEPNGNYRNNKVNQSATLNFNYSINNLKDKDHEIMNNFDEENETIKPKRYSNKSMNKNVHTKLNNIINSNSTASISRNLKCNTINNKDMNKNLNQNLNNIYEYFDKEEPYANTQKSNRSHSLNRQNYYRNNNFINLNDINENQNATIKNNFQETSFNDIDNENNMDKSNSVESSSVSMNKNLNGSQNNSPKIENYQMDKTTNFLNECRKSLPTQKFEFIVGVFEDYQSGNMTENEVVDKILVLIQNNKTLQELFNSLLYN